MTGSRPLGRPELIFFDVGDTLLRAEPSWTDVYLKACGTFGMPVGREQLERALREAAQGGLWEDQESFEATEDASYARLKALDRRVLAALGHPDPPEDFYRALERAFAAREAWHVFPDVLPALDLLRAAGIRRAVISNWAWGAPELLHELDLAACFEALIVSARVGYQKPNAGIFRHALEVTGVAPERAVHIGDSYRADVVGAASVGIRPVLIARGEQEAERERLRSQDPDTIGVPVVRDLPGLLELIDLEVASPVRSA